MRVNFQQHLPCFTKHKEQDKIMNCEENEDLVTRFKVHRSFHFPAADKALCEHE